MDESNAIRAITIGVSTFIAILTISAVMMYYGTAKATVQTIGTGTDISQNYDKAILDILLYNKTTDGAGVKNILNYFYLNERVSVNFTKKITNLGSKKGSATYTVNKNNVNNNTQDFNEVMANIITTKNFEIEVKYYAGTQTEIEIINITEK